MKPRALLAAIMVGIAVLAWWPLAHAAAHPLGNFTINLYSRLELYGNVLRVRYIVDMAEIPAFRERDAIDANHDGTLTADERAAYLATQSAGLARGLRLTANGAPLLLQVRASDLELLPGQGGLETLRVSLWLEAAAPSGRPALAYRDGNYADRLGWHEVVVHAAEGVSVADVDSLPTQDMSHELREYPADLLKSPVDRRSVDLVMDAAHGAAAPELAGVAGPGSRGRAPSAFASLVGRNLTPAVILLSLLSAFGFGALHALEPGHGKTLVAAYFVGARGTPLQAVAMGLIVAVTHTIGVFAIGVVTLVGSRYILPERLYPWLGAASGLLLVAIGLSLLRARLSRVRGAGGLRAMLFFSPAAHEHDGADGEAAHATHTHTHVHGHAHAHPAAATYDGGNSAASRSLRRSLVALGLADGIVPTPSTLVVLLAAISLDRIPLGLLLIATFSVGFASVLSGIALLLVTARRLVESPLVRALRRGARPLPPRVGAVVELMPMAAALTIVSAGLLLAVRALMQPGIGL